MIKELRGVLQRLHYPLEVMLVCVRWYAAYPLSLRHIEEMMAERGVFVDHATVHRWSIKILPVLAALFRRRLRPVATSWRMDETYIEVGGQWKYLYLVEPAGSTYRHSEPVQINGASTGYAKLKGHFAPHSRTNGRHGKEKPLGRGFGLTLTVSPTAVGDVEEEAQNERHLQTPCKSRLAR